MQSLTVGTMAMTVPSMQLSSLTRHHSESCTWTNSLDGNRPMSRVLFTVILHVGKLRHGPRFSHPPHITPSLSGRPRIRSQPFEEFSALLMAPREVDSPRPQPQGAGRRSRALLSFAVLVCSMDRSGFHYRVLQRWVL